MPSILTPEIGLHSAKLISGPALRYSTHRRIHSVRICHDNRPYEVVPWTIPPAAVAAGRFQEPWTAHRDFWIARATAQAGRHDDATHPLDGTPGGQAIHVNLARITFEEDDEQYILANDGRLNIRVDHHRDAVNDEDDGAFEVDDFNLHRLAEGDTVFVDLLQVGSTRPGHPIVVTLVVVPIP
jgi:hypothetical protein